MSSRGSNNKTGSRAARFFVPRSHRLFGVFDNRASAESALAALTAEQRQADDVWFFERAAGARELDPGEVVGPARFVSWLFSHNIETLRELSTIVSDGQVVIAVPARSLRVAEETAQVLRRRGGQWFAYTAHGNFVPMAP